MTLPLDIPVLETERLILRGPDLDDLAPLTDFFAGDHSRFVGGPMAPDATHRALLSTIGAWVLYGYGLWHVAEAATNRFIGWTGLLLTHGKSEPGFAWTVLPEFQGKGLATEAARSALATARSKMGHRTPATFIATTNTASIKIAEKLGFEHETTTGSEMTFRFKDEKTT